MNKHQFSLLKTYLFGFNYNGGEPNEVIAGRPTLIYENRILFHFLYGHHSLSETVKKEDIVAVGDNEDDTVSVLGWNGRFKIINHQKFDDLLKKGAIKLE